MRKVANTLKRACAHVNQKKSNRQLALFCSPHISSVLKITESYLQKTRILEVSRSREIAQIRELENKSFTRSKKSRKKSPEREEESDDIQIRSREQTDCESLSDVEDEETEIGEDEIF